MDRKDILHFVGGKLGRVAKDIFYAILIMELEDYITKDQHYFEEELQSECLFDILTILSFNITRLFMIKLKTIRLLQLIQQIQILILIQIL